MQLRNRPTLETTHACGGEEEADAPSFDLADQHSICRQNKSGAAHGEDLRLVVEVGDAIPDQLDGDRQNEEAEDFVDGAHGAGPQPPHQRPA
jgi:hypothetical protein